MPRWTMTLPERFWSHVDKNGPVPAHRPELGPCWLWTGATAGRFAHGQIRIDGRAVYVHRLAFEMLVGPIPFGLNVLHRCDAGLCVRPTHLFTGTQAENLADMAAKGRAWRARGALSGSAKLTAEAAADIRRLYAAGGATHRSLAARFGVSHDAVGDVLRGVSWQP